MKRYLIAILPLLLLCSFIGTPTNQCSGRFAGPFGDYLNGPQAVTRTYNALDIPADATAIHVEGCFSDLFQYGCEYRGLAPDGGAVAAFTNFRMNLRIEVNGFVATGPMLTPNDVILAGLDSYDGTLDFFGPSGRSGLTESIGTFISFDIPLTPENRALFESDFPVTAIMRMNANFSGTAPNTGFIDGFWRGGITFAVVQP